MQETKSKGLLTGIYFATNNERGATNAGTSNRAILRKIADLLIWSVLDLASRDIVPNVRNQCERLKLVA